MRNFFILVRRFANQLLFLALVIICLILIARTNTLQGNAVLNSANGAAGKVYEKQRSVVNYFRLREMNDSLLHENELLRNELIKRQTLDTQKQFAVKDTTKSTRPDDTTRKVIQYTTFTYRSAQVINNSVAADNNYITINRGSDAGVRPNMAVVSSTGVVGKVVRVSGAYAVVLSALSETQPISGKLKDGTSGLVRWESKKPNELVMRNVTREVPLKIGDTVLTTQYSFFPANIPIGKIKQVMISKKTGMRVLYLQPMTNFSKVQYVYAIENTGLDERQNLLDSVIKQK